MKITAVTYARLYNLGNYENERLEVTVSVEDSDTAAAFALAEAAVISEHDRLTARHAPAAGAPPATPKQRSYIAQLQDDLGWHSEQLAAYANEQKVDLAAMTLDQASRLINGMKRLTKEDLPF
jgi:hypothetical protein